MANIFLTRKCNLKCPYCFADEFVNKDNEEITIENFKAAVEFIKTAPGERVGLIGGEPTTHSKFHEILKILQEDENVKIVTLFTNGIGIDKSIDFLKDKKFGMLVNCNSSKDIGEHAFNKLKNNIRLLKEEKIDFNIGINLYSDKLDYNYIFDLLEIGEKKTLRFATALPNDYKEETSNVLEDFFKFKPYLFKFFNDCFERNIVPTSDCNFIPTCLLDIEDKKTLLKINKLAQENKVIDTVRSAHTCIPVIDILPDLTAIRCFGMSKYEKVEIAKLKTLNNAIKYFFNNVDIYARAVQLSNDCGDCKSRYLGKCGVCFTYKIKQIQKLKDMTEFKNFNS